MTDDTFELRLQAWLDAGPTGAPDDVMEGILMELPGTSRRGAIRARLGDPAIERLAIAAAIAVAVVGTLAVVAPRIAPGETGASLPTVAPSVALVSPAASIPLVTMPPIGGWSAAASDISGYAMELPADWTFEPATAPWPYGSATGEDAPWLDRAVASDGRLEFFGRATDLPSAMTIDAWVTDYESTVNPCGSAPWEPVAAATGAWRMREFCGRFVAVGVVDDRGVVLSLRPLGMQASAAQLVEDRALFTAIVATFAVD